MIINLGQTALHKLLDIFNKNMAVRNDSTNMERSNYEPDIKSKAKASSHRPISITSYIVNVLDRIINTRLKWLIESEKVACLRPVRFERPSLHRESKLHI